MAFSTKEKKAWVEDIRTGKRQYTKKGMEGNPLIGRLVTVDFHRPFDHPDLLGGIASIDGVPADSKDHFIRQKFFIITRTQSAGHASYAVLDGVYPISIYRLRDERTGLHLFNHS